MDTNPCPVLTQATFVSSRLSIWGQQLASLLSGLMYRSLPGNDLPWSAYTSLCAAYNGMLLWLLPGGILEPSGADRAGKLPASDAPCLSGATLYWQDIQPGCYCSASMASDLRDVLR
jgi:hypothetical protein